MLRDYNHHIHVLQSQYLQFRAHAEAHGNPTEVPPPQLPPAPPLHAPITVQLLSNILSAIVSIVNAFSGSDNPDSSKKNKLRSSLLSNRHRSELLNAMIDAADDVVEQSVVLRDSFSLGVVEANPYSGLEFSKLTAEWTSCRDRFMNMLDDNEAA